LPGGKLALLSWACCVDRNEGTKFRDVVGGGGRRGEREFPRWRKPLIYYSNGNDDFLNAQSDSYWIGSKESAAAWGLAGKINPD
jgi:hypothetical protein